MFTESKIILPFNDNEGKPLYAERQETEDRLMSAFGGFTKTAGQGAWQDPKTLKVYREPVLIYSIAAEWSQPQAETLRQIARRFCLNARQECVFVSIAGQVEFIEPEAVEA